MKRFLPHVLMLFLALGLVVTGCAEKEQPAEDDAAQMAEQAEETAGEMAEEAGETASEMAEEAEDTATEMTEEAKETGEKMVEEAKETGEEMVEEGKAMVAEATDSDVDAESIFKAKCVACHGADGQGTAMAPAMVGNTWIKESPKSEIVSVIKNGREGAAKKYTKYPIAMPAQKNMPEEEMNALAAYLKELASK